MPGINLRHGDTMSWILSPGLDAVTQFKVKVGQLADYFTGGTDKLLQLGPEGARATQLDAAKTFVADSTVANRASYATFEGGFKQKVSKVNIGKYVVEVVDDQINPLLFWRAPSDWAIRGATEDRPLGDCQPIADAGEGHILMQNPEGTELRVYQDGAWTSYDTSQCLAGGVSAPAPSPLMAAARSAALGTTSGHRERRPPGRRPRRDHPAALRAADDAPGARHGRQHPARHRRPPRHPGQPTTSATGCGPVMSSTSRRATSTRRPGASCPWTPSSSTPRWPSTTIATRWWCSSSGRPGPVVAVGGPRRPPPRRPRHTALAAGGHGPRGPGHADTGRRPDAAGLHHSGRPDRPSLPRRARPERFPRRDRGMGGQRRHDRADRRSHRRLRRVPSARRSRRRPDVRPGALPQPARAVRLRRRGAPVADRARPRAPSSSRRRRFRRQRGDDLPDRRPDRTDHAERPRRRAAPLPRALRT